MLIILSKTLASFRHKAVLWIMLISIAMSIAILCGFVMLVDHFLTEYQFVNIGWLERVIENSGIVVALVISWFLFPVTVPAIASLFEDKTAGVIERNEYAVKENTHSYPWAKEIRCLIFGIFLNILVIPIYFIPVLNIITYYLLNSWLVGKGLFLLIATRAHTMEGAQKLYEKNSFKIKLYGAVLVFMSTIPGLNLIAPLYGIILMVHYSRTLVITK